MDTIQELLKQRESLVKKTGNPFLNYYEIKEQIQKLDDLIKDLSPNKQTKTT